MVLPSDTGRRGEFLAAYILETYGIEVHHVDRAGADLWCKVNDKIFTVQVKCAAGPEGGNRSSKMFNYRFLIRSISADWFAFVALDRQLLIVRPAASLAVSTFRMSVSEFNEANQRRTIEEMIDSC